MEKNKKHFPGGWYFVSLLFFVLVPRIAYLQNSIVTENALTGTPSSVWDISGAGDLTIQGFATDISVNKGQTVHFKINVDNGAQFGIKIYRIGYYQGNGARMITDLGTFAGTIQPTPIVNSSLGLVDCGNWSESASWNVPSTAVSGVYIARLTKTAGGGASHIVFVVRDDTAHSDILVKTSDATWQAYNVYGGFSLYTGTTSFPSGHAAKVSYNRPFITRNGGGGGGAEEDWFFNAEYPMIRWLERNGYNISYTTDVDVARDATAITPAIHKILMSSGHDEYWSPAARSKFENARDAGVHLAYFSGNEVYWKTRWENSVDGNNTPYRTLVCYKEGTLGENSCGNKCDPLPDVWTGLWRDGCSYNIDGCRPENALTGQISWASSNISIKVPDTYKGYRFWRNTSVATLGSGQTATLSYGTLGYEWDPEQATYLNYYPSGRITLSSTTDGGSTHKLSLYRHSSGALVFGAGTVQWSWGLDGNHDRGPTQEDARVQQATVNLFADMGVQPGSLQAGLVQAFASTDVTPPVTTINAPSAGSSLPPNSPVTISGIATDANVVAGVEVSVDGGITWHLANGTTNWSYSWTPIATGPVTIKSRGYDDSGNMEAAGSGPASNVITVTVTTPASQPCPCTVFTSQVPLEAVFTDDPNGIEVGMKFRASVSGYVTGVRFYKKSGNTGTHTGELYASSGVRLAQAVFTGETGSGWQQVLFNTPVAISSGTTYVAAYHSSAGHYTSSDHYFDTAVVNYPLTALADGIDGPNGVYILSASPAYPTSSFQASNYWVDVVFHDSTNTWRGTVNSAWENPANWSWGILPGANSDVIINVGNPNNPLISSNVTVGSVTMGTGASLSVKTGFKLTISH